MIAYRLKAWLAAFAAFLLAAVALAGVTFLYSLLLSKRGFGLMGEIAETPLGVSLSAITITAPVFAILDALVTWLKHWRENRTHSELIQVIEAQSLSPHGMDLTALEKTCRLPRSVLRARVHELVLLGRLGVRVNGQEREYYLSDVS